jgi:integrase
VIRLQQPERSQLPATVESAITDRQKLLDLDSRFRGYKRSEARAPSHPRNRSWRKTWRLACKAAAVRYRPTICGTRSSLGFENPAVSEQTIKALAGHVSRQMLERYSHIRSEAKQAAIQALDGQAIPQF